MQDKRKSDHEAMENKRLTDLRNQLIIHFHEDATFYERRTYILFFVISGFGLYACLELYNNPRSFHVIKLLILSIILFMIPLLLSFISNEIARKKSMKKAEYFQDLDESDSKRTGYYIRIENGLKITIGIIQLLGVILIAIAYYKCLT